MTDRSVKCRVQLLRGKLLTAWRQKDIGKSLRDIEKKLGEERWGGGVTEQDDCPTTGKSTLCLSIHHLSVFPLSLSVRVCSHTSVSHPNVPLSQSLNSKRLRRKSQWRKHLIGHVLGCHYIRYDVWRWIRWDLAPQRLYFLVKHKYSEKVTVDSGMGIQPYNHP